MQTTIGRLERGLHPVLPCVGDWIRKNGSSQIEFRSVNFHILLWCRPSILALLHAFPVYPVLNRLRSCSEGYTNSDTDKGQATLTGGEMMMSLKDYREAREESVECTVEDRDVDGKEENDGFCYEKHCT